MAVRKLNQVLALEKTVRPSGYKAFTELDKLSQKADLYNGQTRIYSKINDEGEDLPSEGKNIQLNAEDILAQIAVALSEPIDLEVSKDFANCNAKADVVVNGQTLIVDAPATLLLFLEKALTDIQTAVSRIAILDPAERWTAATPAGTYSAQPVATHRTKKVEKVLVLFPATAEHPAQCKTTTVDELAGYWTTTKFSGALSSSRRASILVRLASLIKGVRTAREEANLVAAPEASVAKGLFEYLFS